jgi:PIN domain nuclease of toxin-antitoxin system
MLLTMTIHLMIFPGTLKFLIGSSKIPLTRIQIPIKMVSILKEKHTMSTLNISEIATKLESLKIQCAEIQREMQELGTLLVLAEKYIAAQTKAPLVPAAPVALKAMDNAILGAAKSKRERIVGAATEILEDGTRRSSRYLVDAIESCGVEISGNDQNKKAAALSAYLSKDGAFESDVKAGGWTLKRLLQKAKPGDAPTSTGFSFNGSASHPPAALR